MEAIAAAYGEEGLEKGNHLIPIIIIVDPYNIEMHNTIDWPTCFWAYEIRGFNFSRQR